jgi:mannose-6-phosphate isomerase-like protein (cupin superfamily)
MAFVLTEKHFTTEQDALDEIADRGLQAIAVNVPAVENELHWHDFDSVTFIVDGTARVEFEDGSVMQCGAGARIEAPAGVLHREVSPAYRAVFGFNVDPSEMSKPINKAGLPSVTT